LRRRFENGLSSDNLKDLLDSCNQNLPETTARFRRTHDAARRLLERAVQICGGDEETLRTGQGRLANAYRINWETREDSTLASPSIVTTPGADLTPTMPMGAGGTLLETLAEVVGSQLSDGTDLVSPSGVTRVPNDGMTNTRIQTLGPNQGSASNAGVFSGAIATR
jgi:hypothetical protein